MYLSINFSMQPLDVVHYLCQIDIFVMVILHLKQD